MLTGDALLTLRVNDLAGLLAGTEGVSGPPWYTTGEPGGCAGLHPGDLADLEPSALAGGHGRPLTGPGHGGRRPGVRRGGVTGAPRVP